MQTKTTLAFLTAFLFLLGPASLRASDTNLGKLTDEMEKVKENGYLVLAPETFKKADQQLERAQREDRNNQAQKADQAAREGLKYIEQGNKIASKAMDVLQEALGVRDKAMEAGAQDYFRDQFLNAERQLENATRAIEQGQIETAKKSEPELMKKYSELEIEALKKGTVDKAKSKIEQAKQDGAGGEAPKTLKLAEAQLTLAQSVLEADRTNTGKADEYANRAVRLAGQAIEITRLSRMFKQQNFRHEDVLLWHQDQLQEILKAVDNDIRFDQTNDALVTGLKRTVNSILKSQLESQEASRQEIATKQARIAELEEQLNKQVSEAQQIQLAAEREKQIFKDVKAAFTPEEADVYGKDTDVVISMHGFYFPIGSAEITARNFTLLNKIASAIRQYPKAKVKISGHTDATGNPDTNLKLSVQRAESVLKFLAEVSQLDLGILYFEGSGDTKPIASNKTVEGRAKNRRIEFYIDNPE